MIIKAPIDLELTQSSGQTSQPPWKLNNGIYSDVVLIEDNPVLFQVKQENNNLNFDFTGDISNKLASEQIKTIFDLDFNLLISFSFLLKPSPLINNIKLK